MKFISCSFAFEYSRNSVYIFKFISPDPYGLMTRQSKMPLYFFFLLCKENGRFTFPMEIDMSPFSEKVTVALILYNYSILYQLKEKKEF